MDDDKERRKGEESGGVDENGAERGRGRRHRKTVLIGPDVSPPPYITNNITSTTFPFEPPYKPVLTLSTCGTYTSILRVCDAIWQPWGWLFIKGATGI